jgi:serine O-acetyltransferase
LAFFVLTSHEGFRSVLYYRIPSCRFWRWLLGAGVPALYINTPMIGPGLYFQHGFATIVHAKSIGSNCFINQQVTVGYHGAGKAPVIGNNVSIRAGAKVIGDITIGDNAVIGAGAVVTKSVPPDCVVVGVPAHIVRRNGQACREDL